MGEGEKSVSQEQQEKEARISRTIDVINSADRHRVTGFPMEKPFSFGAEIAPDAGVIFVDRKKPEGQQETKISMEDLTAAFESLIMGEIDDENGTYNCQVGGQQKAVDSKRVEAISHPVTRWNLLRLGGIREMMGEMQDEIVQVNKEYPIDKKIT
jgi:hypothetical protein